MAAVDIRRFKRRFHAWWEGYEPAEEPADAGIYPDSAPAAAPAAAPAPAAPASSIPEIWSPARLVVAQVLWGEGFVFPGGPELAVELVKPFNLAKKKTMLDLGCGLGGGTRAIAKATRAAVRGLELSATLAAAGMAASQKAGMAKKAPIAAWDPAGGKLPDAPVDAVFARQLLGRVDDKPGVVAALAKALKPGGQIMFVELAFPRPDAASPALDAWRAVEDEAPHPPLLEDVANGLIAQGIDVRLAEDMSPAFHARVRRAWAGVAKALPAAGLDPEERRLLLREVELWTCRLAACEAGDLRIARVHGQRKA